MTKRTYKILSEELIQVGDEESRVEGDGIGKVPWRLVRPGNCSIGVPASACKRWRFRRREAKPKVKEIYVLLADGDGTTRSSDTPFGVAVTTEKEAKRYVDEKGVGYTHSYCKVTVFDDKEDALNFAFPGQEERRKKLRE
jgi:hypothetical protein